MFKKYYKEANDDIKPDRELIDKIFERAENNSLHRKIGKVYRFGTVVAAVLVLAVSAIAYPQIVKYGSEEGRLKMKTEEDIGAKADYTEKSGTSDVTNAESQNSAYAERASEAQDRAAEIPDTNNSDTKLKENTADIKEERKTEEASDGLTARNIKEKPEFDADESVKSSEKVGEADDGAFYEKSYDNHSESKELEKKGNLPLTSGAAYYAESDTAVADTDAKSKNDEGYGGSGGSSDGPVLFSRSSVGSTGMGNTVIWSRENYCKYLGVDVLSEFTLPADMKSITDNEFYLVASGGELLNDTATFSFCGSDGNKTDRNITVTTSKIFGNEDFYMNNKAASVKKIGAVNVYTIRNDDYCDAYFKYKEINFTVNTQGISEKELNDFIGSFVK